MKNEHEKVAYEYARHFESWRSETIVHTGQPAKSLTYFRWLPVIDTRVPVELENFDSCVVRIINQITIVLWPTRIIIRFPPALSAKQFTYLIGNLKRHLDDGEIGEREFAWGVSKFSDSFYTNVTSTGEPFVV